MAVGITTTYNSSYHSPGVDITVTGLSSYDTLTIERIDSIAALPDSPVRGADGVATSGATFAVSDYEIPLSGQFYYRATASLGAGTPEVADSSPPITTSHPHGTTILRSVGQPALSSRVNMVDWNDTTRPGRILAEYEVLGRRNKVVITDTLGGREGSLTLTVYPDEITGGWASLSTWPSLALLVEQGGTLLLQSTGAENVGEEDMYLEVKDLQKRRIGIVSSAATYVVTLSYIEVDRPATSGESLTLRTWDDVLTEHATWSSVLSTHATWLDVVRGT